MELQTASADVTPLLRMKVGEVHWTQGQMASSFIHFFIGTAPAIADVSFPGVQKSFAIAVCPYTAIADTAAIVLIAYCESHVSFIGGPRYSQNTKQHQYSPCT